jgi:hypothetical protein
MKRTRRRTTRRRTKRMYKGGFNQFPDINFINQKTINYLIHVIRTYPEIRNNRDLNIPMALATYIMSFRNRIPPPGSNPLYDKLERDYEQFMMAM